MKYLLLPFIALVICCKLNAQHTVHYLDSLLVKEEKKARFGKITTGTRGKGAAFFYRKNNKKIYSIIVRDNNRTKVHSADTLTETGYFFIEDKLVAVRLSLIVKSILKKDERLYFENDLVSPEKDGLNYSAEKIRSIVAKAYELLADGYSRIQKKFTNP